MSLSSSSGRRGTDIRQSPLGKVLTGVNDAVQGSPSPAWSTLGPIAVFGLFLLLPVIDTTLFSISRLELVADTMLAAIGLSISYSFGGQLAIAQPAIMGVAAYAAGIVNVDLHWNAWVTLPIALVLGTAASFLASAPGFRLRGWYLALSTFFAVDIFPYLVDTFQRLTRGDFGLGPIASFPGIESGSEQEYFLFIAAVALSYLLLKRVVNSHWGLVLRSLSLGENLLLSVGANSRAFKAKLSLVSGVPVALAGWLLAHQSQYITPSYFSVNILLVVIGSVVLGGRGSIWGPIVGAAIFQSLSIFVGPFSIWNPVFFGAGVLVLAALMTDGLVPLFKRLAGIVLSADLAARHTAGPASETEPAAVQQNADPGEMVRPPEGTAAGTEILAVEHVTKSFGSVRALDDVSLSVAAGQIHGIVGPNGSGKTTLLNVISGFIRPDHGLVTLNGDSVALGSPFAVARAGLRRSFQVPHLIGNISARQNILLGLCGRVSLLSGIIRTPGYRRKAAEYERRVDYVCALLALSPRVQRQNGVELPLGVRRIVEIGRAVIARPSVVCLDEPAAGLGQRDLDSLGVALRSLAGAGFAILMIEHNLGFVSRVCDTVTVLAQGSVREDVALSQASDARVVDEQNKRPSAISQPGTGQGRMSQ